MALAVWAAVLAWGPRTLAPELSLRASGAATVVLTALGLIVLTISPAPGLGSVILALVMQTAAAILAFDLRFQLIPDLYTAALALAGLFGPLSPGLPMAVAGALLGAALLAGVRWAAGQRLGEEAMGLGDVKLAAALGALLGSLPLLWTVAIAAGLGAAAGLLLRRGEERTRVPFGACLAPVGVAMLWTRLA